MFDIVFVIELSIEIYKAFSTEGHLQRSAATVTTALAGNERPWLSLFVDAMSVLPTDSVVELP